MKKLLALLLVVCMVATLCACGSNDKKIAEHLEAGEYEEAYDLASDDEVKDEIIAENYLAIVGCDASNDLLLDSSDPEDSVLLNAGWFGKVKASEKDAFQSSNSVIAIDNYAKLAEYLSMLSGKNLLEDYYYGLVEVRVNGSAKALYLSRIDIESNEHELLALYLSLDSYELDSNLDALYKYIARQLKAKGTQLSEEAVDRINDRYLKGDPSDVDFEFDLD